MVARPVAFRHAATHGFTRPLFADDPTVTYDLQKLQAAGAAQTVVTASVKSGVELAQRVVAGAVGAWGSRNRRR